MKRFIISRNGIEISRVVARDAYEAMATLFFTEGVHGFGFDVVPE